MYAQNMWEKLQSSFPEQLNKELIISYEQISSRVIAVLLIDTIFFTFKFILSYLKEPFTVPPRISQENLHELKSC